MMWDRIRRDLNEGIVRLQWAGRFLSGRVKVETALAKAVIDSQKIRSRIEEKYRDLGQRIYELKDDRTALSNATVRDLLRDIDELKQDLDLHLARARDLAGPPPAWEEEGSHPWER